jgi:hypothetical protein
MSVLAIDLFAQLPATLQNLPVFEHANRVRASTAFLPGHGKVAQMKSSRAPVTKHNEALLSCVLHKAPLLQPHLCHLFL